MEIENFIRRARLAGRSDEQIREFLISRGFAQADIEAGLGVQSQPQQQAQSHQQPSPPQPAEPLPKTIGLPEANAQPVQSFQEAQYDSPQQAEYQADDFDAFTAPTADLNEEFRPPASPAPQQHPPAPLQQAPYPQQTQAPQQHAPEVQQHLPPETEAKRPKKAKWKLNLKLKKTPVIVAICLLLVGGGAAAYFLPRQGMAQSSNEAVDKFIKAMQTQDKEAADSLTSEAAKAYFQQKSGTQSAYESCIRSGSVCAPLFKADFIGKAQRSEKAYNPGGAEGVETTFLLTTKHKPSESCKEESISTLSISTVPQDGKWMIDKVNPQFDTSSIICPAA